MAKSTKRKPAAEPPKAVVVPPRREVRPFIYAGLNLLFGVLYIIVFSKFAVNRHGWAKVVLYALPTSVLVMGAAMVLGQFLKGNARRYAWIAAVASATAMLVVTVLLICLLLASAAFLSGVYGAFGKAAASGVLAGAALVVQLVGLLPTFQLKFLLTRAGRRAFGLPPLWRKQAVAA